MIQEAIAPLKLDTLNSIKKHILKHYATVVKTIFCNVKQLHSHRDRTFSNCLLSYLTKQSVAEFVQRR